MILTKLLFRLAPLLIVLALAACGSGGGRPQGIPGQFSDTRPHDWQPGRAPSDYLVQGVDVSRFQGRINWRQAAQANVAFAFLKATEGGDVVDPAFRDNWRGARHAGIPRGAYHFYYFCRPAAEQAAWFIANVPAEAGALPPVLDIEWNAFSPTCRLRPDPQTVRSEAAIFLRLLTAKYGQRPIIYTSIDFWDRNEMWRLGGYEFWLRSVAAHPSEKYADQKWTFWQYTGTGLAPGFRGEVDLNAFAGTPAEWTDWLNRRRQ